MFNFNFDLDKNDESERIISYAVARKRPDKQGSACFMTSVEWSPRAEKDAPRKLVNLKTLGDVEIMFPPTLPRGYQMVQHDSWKDLENKIYTPGKECSYEYLDGISQDISTLRNLKINITRELVDYDQHPGYLEWCKSFEEPWEQLPEDIMALLKLAVGRKEFGSYITKPIRVPAPDLVEVLEKMLAIARGGKFTRDEDGQIILPDAE